MRGAMETTSTSQDAQEALPLLQNPRRVRHIASIQVRNLTPFPVRDAFASALKQPAEQSQFTPHGNLSDDLDVTIGRKRGRKLSSTSSITLGGLRLDGEGMQREFERPGELGTTRRRTSSRASVSSIPGFTSPAGPNMTRRLSNAGGPPVVRPSFRQRTISTASSSTSHTGWGLVDARDPTVSGSSPVPDLLRDSSQRGLEKVLQSRLVETFVTLTIQSQSSTSDGLSSNGEQKVEVGMNGVLASGASASNALSSPLGRERASSVVQKTLPKTGVRRSTVTAYVPRDSSHKLTTASNSSSLAQRDVSSNLHAKSGSTSNPTVNGKIPKSPSSPPAHVSRQLSPIFPSTVLPTFSTSLVFDEHERASTSGSHISRGTPNTIAHIPDYISPIHWPSTNPSFQLDRDEFARSADLTSSRVRMEVWGHVKRGLGWAASRAEELRRRDKGKGKERDRCEDGEALEWRVLEGWDVDLGELIPLPEDLACHPSHLPSNTLLITLSPPGGTFYLPLPSRELHTSVTPSEDPGYSSDPELDVRRVRGSNNRPPVDQISRWRSYGSEEEEQARLLVKQLESGAHRRKGNRRTASWQDLLRLVNLQTCIYDTQQSLSEVVREIDKLVTQPGTNTLRREASEREAWIGQLRDETNTLTNQSANLKSQIEAKRVELRRRREILTLAREGDEHGSKSQAQLVVEIADERDCLKLLRGRIAPMRSALLTHLSFILPIEMRSPPDLLFTILSVPLPIPLNPTDPAPPLSVAAHKDVTEETVATALGYAAQVVQLLAAYLGKILVYPITYVGSRSLIKDGISAMVGPRMFPLYSKGVDTYRFEYGVFLLNKDIELLMSDRNLRAMDIRHTLPNLKNLLLTLTDSENVFMPASRSHRFSIDSSASIASLMTSDPSASSLPTALPAALLEEDSTSIHSDGLPTNSSDEPPAISVTTPTPPASAEPEVEPDSPPRSGSTTPTASARKSRGFLDLTPLTGFLSMRVRYPSSSGSRLAGRSAPEDDGGVTPTEATGASLAGEQDSANAEDEDDRRTIRGRGDAIEEEARGEVEGKVGCHANGHAHPNVEPAGNDSHEKLSTVQESATHSEHENAAVLVNGVS
ncbi:hypothetical protein WOLCODRAFT_135001 [Wolfiporia cocos MD-104 SS10]|uniref:Autophagy-related protein 14 n=1 Tax=Wolfiporia cocos (strain MD-104) TaxID=742152 RepID=A0A2H3IU19_WOLCO|nr:hypothetical protein WOLCODRAFT_135001 [Wolfiporia cocos MD-104 SS10]